MRGSDELTKEVNRFGVHLLLVGFVLGGLWWGSAPSGVRGLVIACLWVSSLRSGLRFWKERRQRVGEQVNGRVDEQLPT